MLRMFGKVDYVECNCIF